MASREGFVYRGRSAEDVDQQANQSSSAYDKIVIDRFPQLKVEKGDHSFRVMPPTFAKTAKLEKKYGNHWGLKIIVHRNVGPKDQTYLCLDAMKGEQCPVCEFAKELEADGENEDAYQLRQQSLYLAWAIDRDDEQAGPQVWMVPWTLDRDIGLLCKDKRTNEVILIDHPDEGYDVDFRREGKGLGTKYAGVRVARDSSPIHDNSKKQTKWLAYIDENPLTAVLNFFDPDYLEKQVKATGSKDDDEKSSKKRGRKSSRDEDEDEDEKPKRGSKKPSRDEDEDEDEDEKPKRKGGVKRNRVDEDEDEDEDEKPKSKKKTSSRDEDEDEDEDDKPKGKSKKPSRDEDDEDEDEDSSSSAKKAMKKGRSSRDEDDEDEDEDEKPKSKSKKSSRDEDEDEDEEDEKPKRGKKPARGSDEDDTDEDEDEKPKRGSKKPSRDEDEDEDEDEKPKSKKKTSSRRSADDEDDD